MCVGKGRIRDVDDDSPLFKRRIEVGETETVVHSDSAFGSVSYLRLKNAKLVEKERQLQQEGTHARTPPLLDAVGRRTLKAAQAGADARSAAKRSWPAKFIA